MARKTYIIHEPTADHVRQRQRLFAVNSRYYGVDPSISLAFSTFPRNTTLDDVLVKAALLDRLYSTNVYAIYDMAQHIVDLKIDARLDAGDPALVEDIALLTREGSNRRHYSFATKYCSFSRPAAYHIYDSYVEWLLWEYQKRFGFGDFKREALWSYPSYVKVLSTFATRYQLQHLTAKELDKFLWIEASTLEVEQDELKDSLVESE